MKILDLGCGTRKLKGSIGIDSLKLKGVDIVHNLNKGIPFPKNTFDKVYSSHFIEHSKDAVFMLKEIHRVLKPGGVAEIIVPHHTNPMAYDITHNHFFSWATFEHFKYSHYLPFKFKIIENKMVFNYRKIFGWVNWIINLWPMVYDRFFSYILPRKNWAR